MKPVGKTLGAHVEGRRRKSWPLRGRSTKFLGMTLTACGQLSLGLKELEVITGMWVHTIQWNRSLATCFNGTFACIMGDVPKDQRWLQSADDYFQLMILLPLSSTILGMDVDKVATCSDSSSWGGGISYSVGLSDIGQRRLWEAEVQAVGPRTDDLVVLELFGGIGAGRRACQLLGVQPGSHLSSEIDEGAIRIMQSSFPACVEIGDIEEVTPEKLIHAVSNNPHVKQVLIIGGSPCQDLSGVNIHGQGLEGRNSRLFFAAVKIIFHTAPAAWPEAKIDFMIENVASMKPYDRDRMSQALGVLPIKCCPSSVWPVKRPRYYWLSWGMETTGEHQMMEEEGFTKCTIEGNAKSLASYLPHYQTIPRDMKALPTFMRPISRKKTQECTSRHR